MLAPNDVGLGDDEIFRERAVAVDAHALCLFAQMAFAGLAVAAVAAHDMPLSGDDVAHRKAGDTAAQLRNFSHEFVADHCTGADGLL